MGAVTGGRKSLQGKFLKKVALKLGGKKLLALPLQPDFSVLHF